MIEIKEIAGFDEAKQRKVMNVLLYGTSKAKTALQFETSRGTIIRIEQQMAPILEAEADVCIGQDIHEAISTFGHNKKIKRTPFTVLVLNY